MSFINFNSSDPKIINRSKNIVAIFAFMFIICISIIILLASDSNKKKNIKLPNNIKKINISSPINIKAEDEWLNKSENDLKNLEEQNSKLLKRLDLLEKQLEENKKIYGNTIDSLALQIANTESKILNHDQSIPEKVQKFNEYGELISENDNKDIMTINIDLENEIIPDTLNSFNDLEDYVPAGSYATARMLSGADVSTGVKNQNDPNNMMFEIISPVYAPKFKGNNQEIKKLEGCRVMGAAIGQLWTEKAYVRLLKMSCSFEKGKVAEFNIKGYVTSFAKEGIRGKIVSREGYFTSMAFLAGAIEGLADVAKTAYSPTLEVSTGLATEKIKTDDVARQAGASGLSKAGEMLSDYYINRAEQYQSVVDVPTGIEVEIVFQEGIKLSDDKKLHDKENKQKVIYNNGGLQ